MTAQNSPRCLKCWLILALLMGFASCGDSRSVEESATAQRKQRESEIRSRAHELVDKFVDKYDANTQWSDIFKNKESLETVVYTLEVQRALEAVGDQPIFALTNMVDVFKRNDDKTFIICNYFPDYDSLNDILPGIQIVLILEVSETTVERIIAEINANIDTTLLKGIAVVATVERVGVKYDRVLSVTDPEVDEIEEGDLFSKITIRGKCIDAIFVGDYILGDYLEE